MAKHNVTPQENALGEAVDKTGSFFEENSKTIVWALVAIFVIAGAIYGYRKFVAEPRIEKAAEMIAEAQYRFEAENADFELALNGDQNGAGFLEVIDRYGSTPSGNLAKHYAGICYLRLGDLEAAADYLSQYSPVKGLAGQIINAQNLGLQGDIAVEQNDFAKAADLYKKAAAASDNSFTAPLFLRKRGLALQALGNEAEAADTFKSILSDYPASSEAREVEKLIGSTQE